MRMNATLAMTLAMGAMATFNAAAHGDLDDRHSNDGAQLGPRPFYLVQGMDEGKLKDRLMQCEDGPFYRTDFSIGHRGAALQFPEHSDVSYRAGARMGAGIVECDVTFTKDGELVCRHSECDLHTTTDIVATDLNAKCTVPWTGPGQNPAPKCCTSDLTLDEFKSLKPKMDASNPGATTAQGYLGGTASWRTDLYTGHASVLSFRESIALNRELGVKHTPELKGAEHQDRVDAIFGSQAGYAQKFIDELKDAGVDPKDVWVQSFNREDILYWIQKERAFGRQAVYLDSIDPTANPPIPRLTRRRAEAAQEAGRADLRPADVGAVGGRWRGRGRSLGVRERYQEGRPGHRHLDLRARRPASRRFQRRLVLPVRSARQGDQEGQRHVQGPGRAGP